MGEYFAKIFGSEITGGKVPGGNLLEKNNLMEGSLARDLPGIQPLRASYFLRLTELVKKVLKEIWNFYTGFDRKKYWIANLHYASNIHHSLYS